ncbi:dapper homolog 1 [Mastacembelus armatus]|uniref:Dishevelled-binding antagonist of beta-catenin 1 n=1 Tax=Mastacembelus armatus TaxID=205130 RepID=A0A3Q3RTT8_9TELE|nr:dapper homolog 1 [Mastacembelus armatus]
MLLSGLSRRDADARCSRDRVVDVDAAERLRSVRERLEATVCGLGELEYLRQRQEMLVRAALELREEAEEDRRREAQLSSEEKLLEENILLLRKQLNCLRRRDAGLISQLQELDRQICDLRLDTEASHDQPEPDSRPSSGFYELSDGASGSLSNSSNSVFSECFCSVADTVQCTDELASCLECDGLIGGLCDDSTSSGTVRRSLSAPHPPTLDAVSSVASCDSQAKYHCDLVARNGSDMYRYPSPLHAVAVQSPVFLQILGHGGHGRDEGLLKSIEAGVEGLKTETSLLLASVSAPTVSQSSSWPATSSSQTLSHKRLDSYIYSLVQRRALPIRTSRPRTSISTDPSKSIMRQASLCVKPVSGPGSGSGVGTLRGSELKPSCPTGGASTDAPANLSPHMQWSMETTCEEQDTQNGLSVGGVDSKPAGFKTDNGDLAQKQNTCPRSNGIQNGCSVFYTSSNSLPKNKSKGLLPPSAVSAVTLPKDLNELGSPRANSTPKETKLHKSPPIVKTQLATPKISPKPLPPGQTGTGDRSVLELTSLGTSFQSQEEGGGSHLVNEKYISTQQQNIKLRKGGSKTIKSTKVSGRNESTSERRGEKLHHRCSSKKSHLLDDGSSTHTKASKRVAGGAPGGSSSRIKRVPASIPEDRVLDRPSTLSSARSGASRHHHGSHHHHCGNHHRHHHHHHHHGRDQVMVVAKPKHKRNDYRRLRAIMEVPYVEAFRRSQRRRRRELLSHSAANGYLPSGGQVNSFSPYTEGSDSEYSAECASLFHSTIVDTSEDERSNYTTNCFGDSESSEEEYVEESTTTSDTEESGGGVAGGVDRGWSQLGAPGARAVGQEMTPAQAKPFVKIKASHNLKKKILRFRSGSLKLMTTV